MIHQKQQLYDTNYLQPEPNFELEPNPLMMLHHKQQMIRNQKHVAVEKNYRLF
jgi:hypothetical protein